jgi:hypothetical protein
MAAFVSDYYCRPVEVPEAGATVWGVFWYDYWQNDEGHEVAGTECEAVIFEAYETYTQAEAVCYAYLAETDERPADPNSELAAAAGRLELERSSRTLAQLAPFAERAGEDRLELALRCGSVRCMAASVNPAASPAAA